MKKTSLPMSNYVYNTRTGIVYTQKEIEPQIKRKFRALNLDPQVRNFAQLR